MFCYDRFQLHYPELVQDCKPDIVAATAACDEVTTKTFKKKKNGNIKLGQFDINEINFSQVRKSKKFGKLLEIILLIGNIMNTGR